MTIGFCTHSLFILYFNSNYSIGVNSKLLQSFSNKDAKLNFLYHKYKYSYNSSQQNQYIDSCNIPKNSRTCKLIANHHQGQNNIDH